MLKNLRLVNFEIHKNIAIEDLSPGFNLFWGDSMVGKTSIIRMLKLAAYNQFNPDCVRIGASKCEVEVETEKGKVSVERGSKANCWHVKKNGCSQQDFDKVGTQVVPEAAAVIGMNIVKLGDVDVPVNIMDQLESHFMLSSIGGDKSTGSVRAQVIDEVSGLLGIEGIVRNVSLDSHRFGREIKQSEERIDEVKANIHNETEIEGEERILEAAEKKIVEYEEGERVIEGMQEVQREENELLRKAEQLEEKQRKMPDVKALREKARKIEAELDVLSKEEEVAQEWAILGLRVKKLQEKKAIDIAGVKEIEGAERARLDRFSRAAKVSQEGEGITLQVKKLQVSLARSRKVLTAKGKADEAWELFSDAKEKKEYQRGFEVVVEGVGKKEKELSRSVQEGVRLKRELEEAKEGIKICPINLRPVKEECLKEGSG